MCRLREALRDPELKGKLLNLLGSLNGVLSIDMVSAENKEVLASTLENRVGSKANVAGLSRAGQSEQLVREVERAAGPRSRHYYMLQDPVGSSGSETAYSTCGW